jgi:hypothetical protein
MEAITRVALWSDRGTHYLCYDILCSGGYVWPTQFKLNFDMLFGLESHMKGILDAIFGAMQRIKAEVSKSTWLYTVGDVAQALTNHFEQQVMKGYDSSMFEFIDFMPAMKKCDVGLRRFRLSSLPVKIKDCYHWSFTWNDNRRKNLHGGAFKSLYVSGILAKAHILPYAPASIANTRAGRFENVLKLMPPGEIEADAEADPEDIHYENASDVPMTTTVSDGWRLAYRRDKPDCPETSPHIVLNRLAKKSKSIQSVKHLLGDSQRHSMVRKTHSASHVRKQANAKTFRLWGKAKRKL